MKVKLQTTVLRDVGKSNNPANIDSQAAKKAGLSYWEYMEKTYPGIVQKFVWGAKKLTRKEQRETASLVDSCMARSPRFGFLSQIRNLIGKRTAY